MKTSLMLFVSVFLITACTPTKKEVCYIKHGDQLKAPPKENTTMKNESITSEKVATKKTSTKKEKIEVKERKDIPAKYKWDPSILFASEVDAKTNWKNEVNKIEAILKKGELKKYEGKLSSGVSTVKKAMDKIYSIRLRIEKIYFYASREGDVDLRNSEGRAMKEKAKSLYTAFGAATSYMEPEFLRMGTAKLKRYAKSPKLKDYSQYFHKLIHLKKHILGKKEENILSQADVMSDAAYTIYSTFSNANMEFPTFKDHNGNEVKLSAAMYGKYRSSLNRNERRRLFLKFWGNYKKYRNTFAQMLAGQVKFNVFESKVRKYPDALTAALYPKNIPTSYYKGLITNIHSNLDAFYDYLKLRKKLLGIKGSQKYYDIYPPLVKSTPRKYHIDEAKKTVLEALNPLGKDYISRLKKGFADGSGWIDVFPNKGKRSGAYMDSVYGVHPFVLLNFNGDFNSVSTLAHEFGHALHSVYSNEFQPYAKSNYVIFNAEVASIVNETLLIEYLLKHEKDPKQRRFLLSHYLDSFRGTVFRQTMFAEFELKVYEAYEHGKAITADLLDGIYLNLLKLYHGHSEKVMQIDDLYSAEWSYIPHFYYYFYVYSYVNGFIAATVLADRIMKMGDKAAKQYIDGLLKAGSSKDPLQILKDAGVDMLSPATFKAAIDKFRLRVKELDELTSSLK